MGLLKGLLILGIVLAGSGFADDSEEAPSTDSKEPLTVEMALHEAGRRSPEIHQAQASVEEKRWMKFKAIGKGFLPKVTLSGLHYFDTKYTVTNINFGGSPLSFPGFYSNTAATVDITLPLFNGFADTRNLQAASWMADASEQELTQSLFKISQEVRLTFFQALAAAQLKDVAAQNVKTLEDHLRQVKIQKRGGIATSYDTLRVEVQLNEARADEIDADDNATLTRKKLAVLLGLTEDNRPLQGDLPVPEAQKIQKLEIANVPPERADIQALNSRAEAASREQKAMASLWFSPSIWLGGQYMVYDQQAFNNVVQNTGRIQDAYNVGIFLKWNLFDAGVSFAEARAGVYRTVQAEKMAEQAKLQVPYDFAYWKRRYISNSDHYLSKKFDITRSEEAVRLAKSEERAGTRTSTEVLDAELDLFRARAGVVNAMVKAAEAQIRLELALGRKI